MTKQGSKNFSTFKWLISKNFCPTKHFDFRQKLSELEFFSLEQVQRKWKPWVKKIWQGHTDELRNYLKSASAAAAVAVVVTVAAATAVAVVAAAAATN